MHIVVCAKRVPDTTAKIRPDADGKGIVSQGLEFIISPYDEMALERAVQLKEAGSATKVTVLCLGPKAASKELRKALAMGADEAVHVLEDRPFRDPAATAAALATVLEELAPDVVFCGWKAIDDDSSAVGGYLAARLGMAYASFVVKLEAGEGSLIVHREVEGAEEVIEIGIPCVVTAQKGLAEARFASLKGIMQAKRKPLTERTPSEAEIVRPLPQMPSKPASSTMRALTPL